MLVIARLELFLFCDGISARFKYNNYFYYVQFLFCYCRFSSNKNSVLHPERGEILHVQRLVCIVSLHESMYTMTPLPCRQLHADFIGTVESQAMVPNAERQSELVENSLRVSPC